MQMMGPADAPPMLFAHGYGCDQNMWRFVAPRFADHYRVILFDHIGAGGSDLGAYDPVRYASLDGYADRRRRAVRGAGAARRRSSWATPCPA